MDARVRDLASVVLDYDFAYLATVGGDARARIGVVHPRVADGQVRIADAGARTLANITGNPAVTLVWPPGERDGFSLIVDGQASALGNELAVTPTRAVLHRPAVGGTAPSDTGCAADCVELPLGTSPAQS